MVIKVSKSAWFKERKGYKRGWSFVPINWKGWITLLLLIGLNIFSANYFDVMNSPFREVSKFLVVFLFSLVIFILIAKNRTN